MKLKDLYIGLSDSLKTAGIKSVMLYNTQLSDKPLQYPAAFIFFSKIEHRAITQSKTQIDTSVDLHLIFKVISESDLTYFDLREKVIKALIASGYSIDTESQDSDHAEIVDWIISISLPPSIESYGT